MRACLLVLATACELGQGAGGAPDSADPDSETYECPRTVPGASPAPYCGSHEDSTCSGGCDPLSELCFGTGWHYSLGNGICRAVPVAGTLSATINGVAFDAVRVAGIAEEGYVQIDGGVGTVDVDLRQLAFQVPAALGVHDCSSSLIAFGYADGTTRAYLGNATAPDTCSVTVTAIGDVGQRIEGTFSATLVSGATTFTITGGTFSVERIAYP